MSCRVCGDPNTIRAHLIPRAMCIEVQVGKSHAVTKSNSQFTQKQSGLWDEGILCSSHDAQIGRHEEIALRAFQNLRSQAANKSNGTYELIGVDSDALLKFFASILFKYAITRSEFGKIELGPFLIPIRDFIFSDAQAPKFLDAMLIRPKLNDADESVFAYRAPKLDRKFERNMYRMMVGGVIAFVLIDNSAMTDTEKNGLWMKGAATLKYTVLPADKFEEFQIPKSFIQKNARLSAYLEQQEKF